MNAILWLSVLQVEFFGAWPAQAAAPRAEESVLATYDLRAALPRWDEESSWSQALVVSPADFRSDEDMTPQIDLDGLYGELGAYEVLDLVQQVLGDELRAEGRDISIEGTDLVLLAPQALHEQVRAVLAALARVLTASVQVKVDVLSLAEGVAAELGASSVITQEEAQKLVNGLVGRGAQQREFMFQLAAGRTAWIDQRRSVPFLFDYDVEIAQQAFIYDPVVAETPDGWRMLLRGVPSENGLALSVLFLHSELSALTERPLGVGGQVALGGDKNAGSVVDWRGPQAIQIPEVQLTSCAFDTFLAEGKALVVLAESDLGGVKRREVVVLRKVGGAASAFASVPIPRTTRTLIAVNPETFRVPRFAVEIGRDFTGAHPLVFARLEADSSPFFQEWLKYRFSVWRRLGPWILIVTDPAWDGDSAADLERLIATRRTEPRVLDLAVGLEAYGAPNPMRLALPIREGSTCGVVLGRTTTTIFDYDVEVAQSAAVSDPFVAARFEGLALVLSASEENGGALTLETRGVARLLDGDPATFDPRYPLMGSLDRPELRTLRFDERASLVFAPGQPTRLRIGLRAPKTDPLALALDLAVR